MLALDEDKALLKSPGYAQDARSKCRECNAKAVTKGILSDHKENHCRNCNSTAETDDSLSGHADNHCSQPRDDLKDERVPQGPLGWYFST